MLNRDLELVCSPRQRTSMELDIPTTLQPNISSDLWDHRLFAALEQKMPDVNTITDVYVARSTTAITSSRLSLLCRSDTTLGQTYEALRAEVHGLVVLLDESYRREAELRKVLDAAQNTIVSQNSEIVTLAACWENDTVKAKKALQQLAEIINSSAHVDVRAGTLAAVTSQTHTPAPMEPLEKHLLNAPIEGIDPRPHTLGEECGPSPKALGAESQSTPARTSVTKLMIGVQPPVRTISASMKAPLEQLTNLEMLLGQRSRELEEAKNRVGGLEDDLTRVLTSVDTAVARQMAVHSAKASSDARAACPEGVTRITYVAQQYTQTSLESLLVRFNEWNELTCDRLESTLARTHQNSSSGSCISPAFLRLWTTFARTTKDSSYTGGRCFRVECECWMTAKSQEPSQEAELTLTGTAGKNLYTPPVRLAHLIF